MNSFINQIFYKCNKFDTKNIHLLEKFMLIKNNLFIHDNVVVHQIIPLTEHNLHNIPTANIILDTTPSLDQRRFETAGTVSSSLGNPTDDLKAPPKEESFQIFGDIKIECVKNRAKENNSQKNIWFPSNKDSLFWSIYIGIYELKEYNMIKRGYDNIEMNEKQKILNYTKEHPNEIKNVNYKISNNAIKEIMSELMINKNTSFLTLYSIICYYKKNVYIVKDRSYLFFSYNKNNVHDNDDNNNGDGENCVHQDVLILHMNSKDHFGIHLEPVKQDNIDKIKNDYVCLESFEKPLRGISSYKVSELDSISKKLDIKNANFMKKTELYEKIWNTIKLI